MRATGRQPTTRVLLRRSGTTSRAFSLQSSNLRKAEHDPSGQQPFDPCADGTGKNREELADRSRATNADEQPRSGVAERPEELVVYGGIGRAARDWDSYDRIIETLRRLGDDETLLVQSGKPVGVFRTHNDAPRVLIANSNLVPKWATWEHFTNSIARAGDVRSDDRGLVDLHRTQGIVQGTYETFVEVGRQHYGGDLSGRWMLTAGLGGMGGAQPLAAAMAGRVLSRRRMPAQPDRDAVANRLSRSDDRQPGRGARDHAHRHCTGFSRTDRQRSRRLSRDFPPRHPPRRRHRPDLGARSAQRLSAAGLDLGSLGVRA